MNEFGPLALAILILSAAAFVQSVSGFGLALVATAALPLVMPLAEGIALVSVFNLFVCAVALWHNRAAFSWSAAWPIALFMCLGMPPGFHFLHSTDPALLIRTLGAILVGIALFDLRFSPRTGVRMPGWMAAPLGLIGGVAGGAFNVGGPPIVAYVYSQNWDKARNVAVLQTVFFCGGLTRNALMGTAGDHTRHIFMVLACSALPAAISIALGKKLLERIPKEKLRTWVFLFVLVMGLKYLALGA